MLDHLEVADGASPRLFLEEAGQAQLTVAHEMLTEVAVTCLGWVLRRQDQRMTGLAKLLVAMLPEYVNCLLGLECWQHGIRTTPPV